VQPAAHLHAGPQAVQALFKAGARSAIGAAAVVAAPPYYFPAGQEPLEHWARALVAGLPLPLLLYNMPEMVKVVLGPALVRRLADLPEIVGLKDSSGDIAYAENIAALAAHLKVFPSNEAVLLRAREEGIFAGCISATANINHADCALAYHSGDTRALTRAIAIRTAFSGLPLVPGIKQTLADQYADPVLANVVPPLSPLASAEAALLRVRLQSAQQVCDADASGHADHGASS
jgi:4-hydroxy-tetrahydrodipicolinate synthase